jgi:hypothetical protein
MLLPLALIKDVYTFKVKLFILTYILVYFSVYLCPVSYLFSLQLFNVIHITQSRNSTNTKCSIFRVLWSSLFIMAIRVLILFLCYLLMFWINLKIKERFLKFYCSFCRYNFSSNGPAYYSFIFNSWLWCI